LKKSDSNHEGSVSGISQSIDSSKSNDDDHIVNNQDFNDKANKTKEKQIKTQGTFAESLKKQQNASLLRRKSIKSSTYQVEGKSLYLFSKNNRFRQFLRGIIEHAYFENMIYHLIAVNSLLLMLDEPRLKDPYTKETIHLLDNIISVLFLIECLVKIIVLGFIIGK